MKKIFALLSFLTIMCSCSNDTKEIPFNNEASFEQKSDPTLASLSLDGIIGRVDNNNYIITINTDALERHWENILKNDNPTIDLTNFRIIESYDDTNQKTGYLLNAISTDGKTQAAILIAYDSSNQSFSVEQPSSGSFLSPITYSCSGCNSCRLKVDRFPSGRVIQVNCRPGCVAPTRCTKTETITL